MPSSVSSQHPLSAPAPESAASKNARFWDKMADGYFSKPIKNIDAYHLKLAKTREFLEPHMDVLEFGCGTGGTALAHAPFVNSVHAIDVSSRMIEIANTQAAEQSVGNVTFEQASLDEFDARPERYNVILGLSILHLVEDRDEAIAKVSRLLKPGGIFVSSTGCIGETMGFLKWVLPLGQKLGIIPTLRVFSVKQLAKSMNQQGLEIVHQWKPEKDLAVFMIAKK